MSCWPRCNASWSLTSLINCGVTSNTFFVFLPHGHDSQGSLSAAWCSIVGVSCLGDRWLRSGPRCSFVAVCPPPKVFVHPFQPISSPHTQSCTSQEAPLLRMPLKTTVVNRRLHVNNRFGQLIRFHVNNRRGQLSLHVDVRRGH